MNTSVWVQKVPQGAEGALGLNFFSPSCAHVRSGRHLHLLHPALRQEHEQDNARTTAQPARSLDRLDRTFHTTEGLAARPNVDGDGS